MRTERTERTGELREQRGRENREDGRSSLSSHCDGLLYWLLYICICCVFPYLVIYCSNYASDWTGLIIILLICVCCYVYLICTFAAGVDYLLVLILWFFSLCSHVFAVTSLFPVYHAPGCLLRYTLYRSHHSSLLASCVLFCI